MNIFGKRKIAYIIYATIAIIFIIINAIYSILGTEEKEIQGSSNINIIERNVNFKKKYQGLVIKKFNDKPNHNRETIEVHLASGSTFYLLPYLNDKTGFYDFVQEGDSIFKDDWGFTFRVKRKNYEASFIIHPDYIDSK